MVLERMGLAVEEAARGPRSGYSIDMLVCDMIILVRDKALPGGGVETGDGP